MIASALSSCFESVKNSCQSVQSLKLKCQPTEWDNTAGTSQVHVGVGNIHDICEYHTCTQWHVYLIIKATYTLLIYPYMACTQLNSLTGLY